MDPESRLQNGLPAIRRAGLSLAALAAVLLFLPAASAARPPGASDPADSPAWSTVVLYDGALNTGTPDTQGFFYLTSSPGAVLATQSFSHGVTLLDTMPQRQDHAGYFADVTRYPPLDHARGFQVLFTTRVVTESHTSENRAGFSVLVTSSDRQGIELAFWPNEIWAQEGGTSQLFTHAEGAAFNTTSGPAAFLLEIVGDSYRLFAGGPPLLAGALRDYTAASTPFPVNPYTTPNLIFLGDDTAAAEVEIELARVSVADGPLFSIYLPLLAKN